MSEIKAVLFDMDGVLYAYDFENRLNLLESALGIPAADIRAKVFDSGFEDDADTGAYTLDAYFQELNTRLGVDVSPRQWLAARKWAMAPEPAVLDLARRVKAKVPIAMLTHNGPMMRPNLSDFAPELPDIFGDHIFITSELGSGKEQPETFSKLLIDLGWRPEHTLFIDDNPKYLQGAEQAGLQTHLFVEDQLNDLEDRLAGIF